MTDLTSILLTHAERYPKSELQDFFKLLYQNEFGCGHLVKDLAACISRIRAERETLTEPSKLHMESIGNGYCRMYLPSDDSDELIGRIFYASAARRDGTTDGFLKKTEVFKTLCAEGRLPFAVQDVDAFIDRWKADGMPLFSHSDAYKVAYHPAYRVIEARFVPVIGLLRDILGRRQARRTVVAIDGRCGAGKTTLAAMLADLIDCTVIHMDDFFLPPALRTPERLAEPGGNIHYERFAEEVIGGLQTGVPFSYGVFDCSQMAVTHRAEVDESGLIVIEGSYAHHPKFGTYADLTIFCDVDPAVQKARIIARNGEKMYKNFETRWIPMEERYFHAFGIREKCDYLIK